ncbi:MAG: hypothetical protein R3E95_15130 [Thiolinea sp.]
MKQRPIALLASLLVALSAATTAQATPEEDQAALKKFFTDKFKGIDEAAYKDGAYIFREDAYQQFQEIEADFPPTKIRWPRVRRCGTPLRQRQRLRTVLVRMSLRYAPNIQCTMRKRTLS